MGRIKTSEVLYSFLPRKCSTLWWLYYWRIRENKATLERRIGSFTTMFTKYLHTSIMNTSLRRMEISPFFLAEALPVILGHMMLHLWRKEFELWVIILLSFLIFYCQHWSCSYLHVQGQMGTGKMRQSHIWPPDKLLILSENVIFTNRVNSWGPVWCLAYKRQLMTSH